MSNFTDNNYHQRILDSVGNEALHPTHELGILKRSDHNPILTSFPDHSWANRKVYNAAVVLHDGLFQMVFRAVGDDGKSRLGLATSTDGISFQPKPEPIFEGQGEWESHGAEDPRITFIDNQFVMGYTAYDGTCAREAIAVSNDLRNWERYGVVLPHFRRGIWNKHSHGVNNWTKAGAIFPEKINGKYMMLFGDDYIWPAYSDDLRNWEPDEKAVLIPRSGFFDAGFLEMGPPPIKTDKGWLVIYHGIESVVDRPGKPRIYRFGAAILDINDPSHVLWRCTVPILEPKGKEKEGQIDIGVNLDEYKAHTGLEFDESVDMSEGPSAIFTCGAVKKDETIYIYYSSMDTAMNLATTTEDDILKH